MKIIYNNSDISKSFKVLKCEHDSYAENQSDTLVLKLYDTRGTWSQWKPAEGDTINVSQGNSKTGNMYVNEIFPESDCITFRASSIRKSTMLPRQKSWEHVYFKQVVEEIAKRNNMEVNYYGVYDYLYGWISQDNVNDFSFLNSLCSREGYSFVVYDGNINVFSYDYLYKQDALIKITVAPSAGLRMKETIKYGSCVITNGVITGTYKEDETLQELSKIIDTPIQSTGEANRFAKAVLDEANKSFKTGVFKEVTKCLTNISAGSVINLSDSLNRYSSKVFINHIRHDYVNANTKLWFREV